MPTRHKRQQDEQWDKDEKMMMDFLKELYTASNPPKRNWRGIFIALLIIGFVIMMVTLAILILSKYDQGPKIRGSRVKLVDVLEGTLKPSRFNGTWISEDEIMYMDHYWGLSVLNVTSDKSTSFMPNNSFRQLNAASFSISADLQYVLLIHDIEKISEYKKKSKYSIYDNSTQHHFAFLKDKHAKLYWAGWMPKGNSTVYIAMDNNIYYNPSIESQNPIKVTDSGEEGVIYNGITDPVYEEILQSDIALWISPDAGKLAYGSFNDSNMDELYLPTYGYNKVQNGHPYIKRIRYARPGRPLPRAVLHVVDKLGQDQVENFQVTPPKDFQSIYSYFTSVQWIDKDTLGVTWVDRTRTTFIASICQAPSWQCEKKHCPESRKNEWVASSNVPLFSKDKKSFLLIEPANDGDNGKFHQVSKCNVTSTRSNHVTYGKFEVIKLIAWDQDRDFVYFLAAPNEKPEQQNFYRVENGNSGQHKPFQCLNCLIKQAPEDEEDQMSFGNCTYVDATPSPSLQWMIIECLGPAVPKTYLLNTDTLKISLLNNNTALREQIAETAFPQVRTFKVKLPSGSLANVRLMLPPGWRDQEEIKYPLVVEAFGTYGHQSVKDAWEVDWGVYLAAHGDVMYAKIDGAGSPNQGLGLLLQPKRKLGGPESEDLVYVTNYLLDNLSFLDDKSVAVWGWGYGGYVALKALALEDSPFPCGLVVAPITNWLQYSAVFTEKYMGEPNDTERRQGYANTDLTTHLDGLIDKDFYIIHGSDDVKVPLDQTMFLTKELAKKYSDIHFKQQVYADEDHTFSGVKTHLYRTMERFLGKRFKDWITLEGGGGES